jgi:hypothetical protein
LHPLHACQGVILPPAESHIFLTWAFPPGFQCGQLRVMRNLHHFPGNSSE